MVVPAQVAALAAEGLPVFPVFEMSATGCACGGGPHCTPGKHPRVRWRDEATTDPARLAAWGEQWPTANWGLAIPPGLVVVDIDPRNGGDQTWAKLDLPPTRVVLTGGGGAHLYYRAPPDLAWPRQLGPGVDLKAHGGYVLVPPSNHALGAYSGGAGLIQGAPPSLLGFARRAGHDVATTVSTGPAASAELVAAMAAQLRPAWDAGNRQSWFLECLGWLAGKHWSLDDLTALVDALGESAGGTQPTDVYRAMVERARPLTGPAAAVRAALGPAWPAVDGLSDQHPAAPHKQIEAAMPGQPEPQQARFDNIAILTILACDAKGRPKSTPENVRLVLEYHPSWRGNLRFNGFAQTVEVADVTRLPDVFRGAAREPTWSEQHTIMLRCWCHQALGFEPGREDATAVLGAVARLAEYSPVVEYLRTLRWDGRPRIDHWLATYLGARADDPRYLPMVGPKFLISAVARAALPGCKVDTMLILEGEQGIGKSSAVRILAGDGWFDDTDLDVTNKDASLQLRGVWIYEWGELHALTRSETTRVKAWVSKQSDRFRAPYAREVEDNPRRAVFIGTTNGSTYLTDTTGNRRYWPVTCGRIDLAALARDRDQLWAEAAHRWASGERHYLVGAENTVAAEQQEARVEEDSLEERAEAWVAANPGRGLAEVLLGLGYTFTEQHKWVGQRVGQILSRTGRRVRERLPDGTIRARYYPK